MLELLNQLDGFDSRGDVKVCGIHREQPRIGSCLKVLLVDRLP